MERFFNWLNKEPETANEGILITLTALGMFIAVFVCMSLVSSWING